MNFDLLLLYLETIGVVVFIKKTLTSDTLREVTPVNAITPVVPFQTVLKR
jgi:hypothetical protein